MGEVKYLDDPAKWPILAEKLYNAKEFGYDTETYGQPDKTSPQHRARIHCFSIGLLTNNKTAKGYRKAVGCVLPREALDSKDLRQVFADTSIIKWAHNAPHDIHATRNEGVEIVNCQDSLQWYRVAFPGMTGYGLKAVAQWALGYDIRPTFIEMVTHNVLKVIANRHIEKGCLCGAKPCHARSNKEFLADDGVYRPHTRVTWRRFTPISKLIETRYKVTDFVPGAVLDQLIWQGNSYDRWLEWLKYSVEDSIQGIEAVDYLRNKQHREVKYPWQIYQDIHFT